MDNGHVEYNKIFENECVTVFNTTLKSGKNKQNEPSAVAQLVEQLTRD